MRHNQRVAFDLFYAEHAMPAFRFALRLSGNRDDAEDLVAEALAKAYRNWWQYRGSAQARTWLFAIVRNEWRMLQRRRPRHEVSLDSAAQIAATLEADNLALAEAILALPEPLREAFLLVKGEGLTHAEAAKVVHVPPGTMSFRVHSAIQKLRLLMSDDGAEAQPNEVFLSHEM